MRIDVVLLFSAKVLHVILCFTKIRRTLDEWHQHHQILQLKEDEDNTRLFMRVSEHFFRELFQHSGDD